MYYYNFGKIQWQTQYLINSISRYIHWLQFLLQYVDIRVTERTTFFTKKWQTIGKWMSIEQFANVTSAYEKPFL